MLEPKQMTSTITTPLALLPLALLLAGCGGGGSGSSSSPAPAPAPLAVSAVTPSGLTATLAENAATVPVGGAVTYTLTLTNNTPQAVTYVSNGAVISGGTPLANGAVGLGNTIGFSGSYFQIVNAAGQTVYPPHYTGGTSSGVGGLPAILAAGQSTSATFAPSGVFTAAGRYTATAPVYLTVGTSGAGATTTTLGPLAVTAQ